VTLSARWDHREVILTVKDSGIGIDPEDQPYVFDRFYKADKAHTSQGSGLGLSIAREILQILGERIWLDSEPGVGSAFSFSLKREDPAAPGNRAARP
jgi:signal transduction histidine kinase